MGFGFLRFHTLYLGILIIPFGLLLRMALNALDGMMARTIRYAESAWRNIK